MSMTNETFSKEKCLSKLCLSAKINGTTHFLFFFKWLSLSYWSFSLCFIIIILLLNFKFSKRCCFPFFRPFLYCSLIYLCFISKRLINISKESDIDCCSISNNSNSYNRDCYLTKVQPAES